MGMRFSNLEKESESEADNGSSSNNAKITKVRSLDDWKKLLDEYKNNNKLMVVNFTASWCVFCETIAPTVKEYAQAYCNNVKFVKIDMASQQDAFMDVAREFDVKGYPTFIMMKNGKQIDKVVGAKKDELKTKIEECMNK